MTRPGLTAEKSMVRISGQHRIGGKNKARNLVSFLLATSDEVGCG